MAPPNIKRDYERLAWSWAETTNPCDITQENIESAYRCNIARCSSYSCRRNCKGNPFCLASLGESRWFNEQKHDSSDDYDPDQELRDLSEFIGLKNLGATCYVNSLLQLWFHNLPFRKAVLDWNPNEDTEESLNPTLNSTSECYVPQTAIGHLQMLFALMQHSNRVLVDPTDFVLSLGLDRSYQQDAQEFSKLFLSNFVEEKFSIQSLPHIKNFIKDYFCGEYVYVTKCFACGNETDRSEIFYELVVNVCKTLDESVREFLKEERLEKDDQYFCNQCGQKQDAGRRIRLQYLPKVLNLQLMRFVFDRTTGTRKKLNSYIQFPETLDLASYLGSTSTPQTTYKLSAVLMHCGSSAHSGHYVAHICDSRSGHWYKFNDENVEKIEGNRLKFGPEEDVMEGMKKVKPPKAQKFCHTSKNAYMLVYARADSEDDSSILGDPETWPLQSHIGRTVEERNEEHESFVHNMKLSKDEYKKVSDAKRSEMLDILGILPVPETLVDLASVQVISVASLTDWMQNRSEPVDNSPLLCPHDKLCPSLVRSCKYVTAEGATKLFEHLSGGPQLCLLESICRDCVLAKCKFLRIKKKTTDDAKEMQSLLKSKLDMSKPTFWVGKNSLKCWKSLVNKELAIAKIAGASSYDQCSDENKVSNNSEIGITSSQCNGVKDVPSIVKNQPSPLIANDSSNTRSNSKLSELVIKNDPTTSKENPRVITNIEELEADLKNRITMRKRTINDVKNEDELPLHERAKRLRTGCYNNSNETDNTLGRKVNRSSQTIDCENSPAKPFVKSEDYGIEKLKSSMNPELRECAVMLETMETTFSALKSKLYKMLKNQEIYDNLNERKTEPLVNGQIDDYSEGYDPSVNSEQILNSKIKFNPYVNVESPDNNTKSHLKLNMNCKVKKENSIGKSESLDNDTSLSPMTSYNNTIDNVLEKNKRGKLKSPEMHEVMPELSNYVIRDTGTTKAKKNHHVIEEIDLCDDDEEAHNKDKVNGFNERRKNQKEENEGEEDEESGEENSQREFNEDILCPHGDLIPDEGVRRLVPEGVWNIFSSYFPSARSFTCEADPCKQCLQQSQQDEMTKEENRRIAAVHRESFSLLLNNKSRPVLSYLIEEVQNLGPCGDNDLGNSQKLYLISREFLDHWKRFLRESTRREVPRELSNISLICDHGKLLYEPELECTSDENSVFVLVSEEEWSQLKEIFPVDYEISTFYCSTVRTFINLPDICEECVNKRKESEEQEQLIYTRGKLVIRVANSDDSAAEDKKTDDWNLNGKGCKAAPGSKSGQIPLDDNSEMAVRRSQRKRKAKNDIILTVASSDTLLSVKLKIMKRLSIAPYDQNLIMLETGRMLDENSATLQQLNVHQDSVIILKVNETHQDEATEFGQVQQQELGFSGTKLLGLDS